MTLLVTFKYIYIFFNVSQTYSLATLTQATVGATWQGQFCASFSTSAHCVPLSHPTFIPNSRAGRHGLVPE